MERLEVLQFKRQQTERPKNTISDRFLVFSAQELFILILAFLLGRCSLFSRSFFSSAYVASFKKRDYMYYLASLFSIFGIISCSDKSSILKYVLSILLITTINHFFDLNLYSKALLCALSVGSSGSISIFLFSKAPIEFLYLVLEMVGCFWAVIMFERFFAAIYPKKAYTADQTVVVVVVLALSFLGLSNSLDSVLDIENILFFILLFAVSLFHGMIMSTAMGFVIGLLESIKECRSIEMACVFAFSSLLAGLMKGFGKLGIALGGFCGYIISMFYISSNPTLRFREILISAVLFCLFPLEKIVKLQSTDEREVQRMIKEKIFGVASIIENIQQNVCSKPAVLICKDEAKNIVQSACQKLCLDCGNSNVCWNIDYHRTNHSLNEIKNIILKKGKLSQEDLKEFRFLCEKAKEFEIIINGFLESLKYSKLVQEASSPKENMFKTHIEILKDIVIDAASMAENEAKKDMGTSREIELELVRFGYEVEKVDYVGYDHYFQIDIDLKDGFKAPRKMEIEEIVKGVVGCSVEIISEVPKISGGYTVSIIKKPNVHIDYSIYSKSKENINGDRVCFLQLKNGKFLACISDGMGTGKTASENSFIVIDALKKFSSLGFDRKIAIRFINSLLSIKNAEEFASVDVVCIDRFTLTCEFLKAGAMPTFIKRGSEVLTVESNSLPVGIEAESQFDFSTCKLQKGDMIFMFSDGLFELLGEDGDRILKEFIAKNQFVSTQSSAKQIFEWAISNSFLIKDDVTIIVLKVGGGLEKRGE
ncbi:stage II sporulation protein E [Caldicellulosiruptor bescii]|uniref:Protein serine/threonine phosphatase n=2 Tax=Caldicellulosiruptor bescii TaxID=31899 RepID=B9MMD6_CALBD|nr:SpoIIE family protein phosphatase [Caldicellulosiruptor bescii]ACM59368.1 protein serine/threonine phosphatase [Caldicellulosiruptor bescii DSM 6725]PBC88175.1 stage II sporulation protein E [Caldicellulosiruptor bescii]PBC92344.1 stage II sporulation protein E [Caldicellulosiruptor bescii]PBD04845.1 stage II sporulation protein E [Caldicellulosiruptor bescii]PBD05525.1 stage II sporulation protein E [Caldicellulosiruptor bescii]